MRNSAIARGMRQVRQIKPDFVPFSGGLDVMTPPFTVPPGRLRSSQNWEIGINEGYDLSRGYERYDGQAAPSSATYTQMDVTVTGSLQVADVVTGVTSAATGTIIAMGALDAYIVMTKVTGTFVSGETLNVSASPEGTADSAPVPGGAGTAVLNAQYTNLAADSYRADILVVPGSGNVLGCAFLNDITYGFRANAGGTAVDVYKSTSSGWSQVALGFEMAFTSGGTTEITEGQTITGATSAATAVLTRVMLESGSWTAGDAAGKFIFASQTGTFQAENIDVGASSNLAAIAADSSAITLAVGGRFSFFPYDFGEGLRLYGVDKINRGFEFDGTVFCPISTGMTTDTPNYVVAHKNHLFFAYGSSLQHSGIKAPYSWTVITGAAELLVGDEITSLSPQSGSEINAALSVFSKNTIHTLYGSSSSDWQLDKYKDEVGARAYSVQTVVNTFFLDDRGVTDLRAVQAFGNFSHSTISKLIQSWINARKGRVLDSCIVRDKAQVRMFFNDKSALYVTFREGKLVGMMPQLLDHYVRCMYSREYSTGIETIKFGSDDGYIYECEKGTSFDGGSIDSFLVTHFHHSKSPRTNKDYVDMTLEVTGTGYSQITVGYELGYGSTNLPQPADVTETAAFSQTIWDDFTWDAFYWDGKTIAPSVFEVDGSGENISIAIRTNSDYFQPIKVSGAYLRYRDRDQLRYSK